MSDSRKRDKLENSLIRAADAYLRCLGGSALIGGPCCIMSFPGKPEGEFYVAVKMEHGKRPPNGASHE